MKSLIYAIVDGIAYAISRIINYYRRDKHAAEVRRNGHLDGMLHHITEKYDVDRALLLQVKNGITLYSGIHLQKLVATNEYVQDGIGEVRDHFQGMNATVLGEQTRMAIQTGVAIGHTKDLTRSIEQLQNSSVKVEWYGMLPISHPTGHYTIGYLWLHNLKDKPITAEQCMEMKEQVGWFGGYLTKRYA
jgi:hypothetical protein